MSEVRSDSLVPFQLTAFEREIESALAKASVYDVNSYGWLNENDADPHFIGHAMWQIDQPSIDFHALFGESPVNRRPQGIEKQILTAGEDFCALMQAVRLSIGLALLWQTQAHKDPWNESSFFWLHHTDAFLKLAIASDRLRDLLVIACTRATRKSYQGKGKPSRNHKYVMPYREACELLTSRGLNDDRLVEPLAALPELAEKLFTYIARRHKIVHEIATHMAKVVRDNVSLLQHRYDQEQEHGFSPRSDAEWFSVDAAYEHDDESRRQVDHALHELRDWYILLIQASNCVFQIEYWSRVLGPTSNEAT
jgi:hypothetical protein